MNSPPNNSSWVPTDYAVVCGINPGHVQRLGPGNADPAPLPDRITMDAVMLANQLASYAYNLTATRQAIVMVFRCQIPINKPGIVAVRNKANLLRLRLLGYG